MTEYLFARKTDVDAVSATAARDQAVAAAVSTAADVVLTHADVVLTHADVVLTHADVVSTHADKAGFDAVWRGNAAADPGTPLEGQLYWNTVSHVLRIYNGSSWGNYSAASGITAIVQDLAPQLGGNLDPNGHTITGYLTSAAAASAYQPLDSDLTSWALITRASGFDTFTATPTSANLRALLTDEAGSGAAYFVGGALGTPSSGTLSSCSGYALASVTGFGTGVATALAIAVGSAGGPVVLNGAGGTPSAITLTNGTGLPISGLTASTSTAIGVGSIELGHATANTLTAASGILSIEGIALTPGMPINSQSAAYGILLADANTCIYHPAADNNARTFTIPANGTIALPVGTVLHFLNGINTVTIAITTDTLTLLGNGATGSRTLAANGWATAVKVSSQLWYITGSNLT